MVEPTATEEKLWQSDFPGGKIGEWQDVIGKTNRELAESHWRFHEMRA